MATSLLIQNNLVSKIIRQSSALTISFAETEVMNIQGANQVQLLLSFIKGDSEGCRLKIEYSEDRVTWYQESMISEFPSLNSITHSKITREIDDTGNYVLSIPVSSSYIKVSVQAISSGDNTLLSIKASAANI
ncbi:MAG: hypothetical protein AAB116_03265 [Candidatus Poribacteria bacterium]